MDRVLWESVRSVLAEQSQFDAEPASGNPTCLLDYGAYFDLTLVPPHLCEVPPAARAASVAHLRSRLAGMRDPFPAEAAPLRISNFSSDDFSLEEIERMRRWWDIEPANLMAMTAATPADRERSVRLIGVAMDHLGAACPALHEEVHIIVRDIVLSRPDGTNRINYGGASSFALWGALTINTETHHEWTQFYRQIVHEAAHNLLFAIARDGPLIENDPAERRGSPLRADPRPMDGIFHAAFVSAREALACDTLLVCHEATGRLDSGDAAIIDELLGIAVLAFWDCIAQLREHARLTELGVAVLADCEAYMNASFTVEDTLPGAATLPA